MTEAITTSSMDYSSTPIKRPNKSSSRSDHTAPASNLMSNNISAAPLTPSSLQNGGSSYLVGNVKKSEQSERVRLDLVKLEEAKRVESLRGSFLIAPTLLRTPPSNRNSIISIASSCSSKSSVASSSRGEPLLLASSTPNLNEKMISTEGPLQQTPFLEARTQSQPQPSPDTMLSSVLANFSLQDTPPPAPAPTSSCVSAEDEPKLPKRRSFLSKLTRKGANAAVTDTEPRINEDELSSPTQSNVVPPPPRIARRASSRELSPKGVSGDKSQG